MHRTPLLSALAAALLLTGCEAASPTAGLDPAGDPADQGLAFREFTRDDARLTGDFQLGAGDTLGAAVFHQHVALVRAQQLDEAYRFADVPTD